jgi:hypothetical protein
MTTVLTESGATMLPQAQADGDALWLAREDVPRASGWTLKPEGLCHGDICVPVPRHDGDQYIRHSQVNIAAFWRLLGRPVLHDAAGSTWMLGAAAADRAKALKTLEAPDFRLPDLDGKLHALSDYRGKRVFLTTWSSW